MEIPTGAGGRALKNLTGAPLYPLTVLSLHVLTFPVPNSETGVNVE
jgi:hypothetical protein